MYEKKAKNSGVSLIEVLLVVAIIGALAVVSYPSGANFIARSNLRNKTNELLSSLRTAQLNVISGKEDSSWGVFIDSSEITLFKGDDFVSRDPVFDQSFSIPGSITITSGQVVFTRADGNPTSPTTFVLSTEAESVTVSVNELGIVDLN